MSERTGEIINRNFADIFSGEMRYVIPFFQRGYVWGSRNWNQLKQDIEEQILEPAQNGDLADQEHFFGPAGETRTSSALQSVRHHGPEIHADLMLAYFSLMPHLRRLTTRTSANC